MQDSSKVLRASWQYWLQYSLPSATEQLHAGCPHLFGSTSFRSCATVKSSTSRSLCVILSELWQLQKRKDMIKQTAGGREHDEEDKHD